MSACVFIYLIEGKLTPSQPLCSLLFLFFFFIYVLWNFLSGTKCSSITILNGNTWKDLKDKQGPLAENPDWFPFSEWNIILQLVPGILRRGITGSNCMDEWVSEWKSLSCFQLFVTPWTVACQVPLSMGFSRQVYWSGLPFPPPGDLPDPGIQPGSPTLLADSLPYEPPGKPNCMHSLKYSWRSSCVD